MPCPQFVCHVRSLFVGAVCLCMVCKKPLKTVTGALYIYANFQCLRMQMRWHVCISRWFCVFPMSAFLGVYFFSDSAEPAELFKNFFRFTPLKKSNLSSPTRKIWKKLKLSELGVYSPHFWVRLCMSPKLGVGETVCMDVCVCES